MGKVLRWRDQKTALEEASDFEKEVGFDGVIVIGLVKDQPGDMYVGMTKGLSDAEIVYLLECAKHRVCLETILDGEEGK